MVSFRFLGRALVCPNGSVPSPMELAVELAVELASSVGLTHHPFVSAGVPAGSSVSTEVRVWVFPAAPLRVRIEPSRELG